MPNKRQRSIQNNYFGDKKKKDDDDRENHFLHNKLCQFCKSSVHPKIKNMEKKNFTTSTNVCHLEGTDCYVVMKATETYRKEPKPEVVQIKKNELKEAPSMHSPKKTKSLHRRHVHKNQLNFDRVKKKSKNISDGKTALSAFQGLTLKRKGTECKLPGWYQELSYQQMGHLHILNDSMKMDREENVCTRTNQALSGLGISPMPHHKLINKCIHLSRDSGIFFLIYLYKFTGFYGYTTIPENDKDFDINSRLYLSGVFYLALERTIHDLELNMPPPLPYFPKSKKVPFRSPSEGLRSYISLFAKPLYFPFKENEDYYLYKSFQTRIWKELQNLREFRSHRLKRFYSYETNIQKPIYGSIQSKNRSITSQGTGGKKLKQHFQVKSVCRPETPIMPGSKVNRPPFSIKKQYSICSEITEVSENASYLFDTKDPKIGLDKHKASQRESRRYGSTISTFGGLDYKKAVTCGIWDKFLTLKPKDRENLLKLIETKKAFELLAENRVKMYGADLDLNEKSMSFLSDEESICLDEIKDNVQISSESEEEESEKESLIIDELGTPLSVDDYEEQFEEPTPIYCTCMTKANVFDIEKGFPKCCGHRRTPSDSLSDLYPYQPLILMKPPIKLDPYFEDADYLYNMTLSIIENELMDKVMKNYPNWPPLLKEETTPSRIKKRPNSACIGLCSGYFPHYYFHRMDEEEEEDVVLVDSRLFVDDSNIMPSPIKTNKVFKAHLCGYWEGKNCMNIPEEVPTETSEETNIEAVKSKSKQLKPTYNTEIMLIDCLTKMNGNPISYFPNVHKVPIFRQWLRMRNHECVTEKKKKLLLMKMREKIKNQLTEPKIRAQLKILSKRKAEKLTWNDIKWVKSKALKVSTEYRRQVRSSLVNTSRIFWTLMLQEYYPHRADFRSIFFSYLPACEPNLLIVNPPN